MNPENLKEFILYKRRITIKKAAEEIGLSRVHLTNIVNGIIEPGSRSKKKIKDWHKKSSHKAA